MGGFSYLGLLGMLALGAVTSLAAVGVAETAARREREAELLFAGDAIRKALTSYVLASAGAVQHPRSLDQLLEDRRGPVVRRHLRRIHADPMTGRPDWQVIRTADGGVAGVASTSRARPITKSGFPPAYEHFAAAERHADWRFVLDGGAPPPAAPAARGNAVGGTQTVRTSTDRIDASARVAP